MLNFVVKLIWLQVFAGRESFFHVKTKAGGDLRPWKAHLCSAVWCFTQWHTGKIKPGRQTGDPPHRTLWGNLLREALDRSKRLDEDKISVFRSLKNHESLWTRPTACFFCTLPDGSRPRWVSSGTPLIRDWLVFANFLLLKNLESIKQYSGYGNRCRGFSEARTAIWPSSTTPGPLPRDLRILPQRHLHIHSLFPRVRK